jgi:hypothetical protein
LVDSHTPFVLSVTVGTIIISFIVIAFGMSTGNLGNHQIHEENPTRDLSNLEHRGEIIRAGDAKIFPSFSINRDFVDPDNNCDFCTRVNYSSSIQGQAAIAYQINGIDVSNSKRMIFFARGDIGGEQITLLVAGKDLNVSSSPGKRIFRSDLFSDTSFGIVTEPITLTKHWKRFIIDLQDSDLGGLRYPFGLIIPSYPYSEPKVFYIKGITFDEKKPGSPLLISSNKGS